MGAGNAALPVNDENPHSSCLVTEPTELLTGLVVRVVRDLSQHDYFCRKLIQHFDILWQQNMIKWPKQHGTPCPEQSVHK
jgi:hypothetical protein